MKQSTYYSSSCLSPALLARFAVAALVLPNASFGAARDTQGKNQVVTYASSNNGRRLHHIWLGAWRVPSGCSELSCDSSHIEVEAPTEFWHLKTTELRSSVVFPHFADLQYMYARVLRDDRTAALL